MTVTEMHMPSPRHSNLQTRRLKVGLSLPSSLHHLKMLSANLEIFLVDFPLISKNWVYCLLCPLTCVFLFVSIKMPLLVKYKKKSFKGQQNEGVSEYVTSKC